MDWILIGSIVVAGWAMLSVLSGERMRKSQQAAVQLAAAVVEQAKANEIPIARSSEGPIGSIGGKVRKAA